MLFNKVIKNRKYLAILFLASSIFSQNLQFNWSKNVKFSDSTITPHFNIYFYKASYTGKNIDSIIEERENGYTKLSEFFNLSEDFCVNLYLFPNEKMKYEVTGHKGFGWGFANNIIEVMNDSIRIDPYHELVHIFCYKIGRPPAMFDEGLAVHLSEKFGSKYFTTLVGYPNKTINDVFQILSKEKDAVNMEKLSGYKEISDADDAVLAYIQSAAFVDYILNEFGKDKFLNLIKGLRTDNQIHNTEVFKKIYGFTYQELSRKWVISK